MKLIEMLDIAKESTKKLEINENALKILKDNSTEELLNDKEKCIQLIKYILQDYGIEKGVVNRTFKRKSRAIHTISLWLMGIGINTKMHYFNQSYWRAASLWTLTSIAHDYGYYADESTIENVEISELTKNYSLLDDKYKDDFLDCLNGIKKSKETKKYFTYDYEIVKRYFEYSKYYNSRFEDEDCDYKEKCDHGIVGGCLLFNQYCNDAKPGLKSSSKFGELMVFPSNTLSKIVKISCSNVAYHNMFKSNPSDYYPDSDIIYGRHGLDILKSDAPIIINGNNQLLLLLSLIDTIECYKRFSKKESEPYLENKTIVNKINIKFKNKCFYIDYSYLAQTINKRPDKEKAEKLIKSLDSHIKGIKDLEKWTIFKVNNISDYEVKISIDKQKKSKLKKKKDKKI